MPEYLVRYTDQDGRGATSMQSPKAIDVEQAVEALTEQLTENDIPPDWMQIDEFIEIKNPVTWLRAEIGRLGLF